MSEAPHSTHTPARLPSQFGTARSKGSLEVPSPTFGSTRGPFFENPLEDEHGGCRLIPLVPVNYNGHPFSGHPPGDGRRAASEAYDDLIEVVLPPDQLRQAELDCDLAGAVGADLVMRTPLIAPCSRPKIQAHPRLQIAPGRDMSE